MKTTPTLRRQLPSVLLRAALVALLLWSCSDPEVSPVRPQPQPQERSFNKEKTLKPPFLCRPEGPHYNLDVILRGRNWRSLGFVKFRQYQNETQMIHLDTWIYGLDPNTAYVLQRAVDTTLDRNCTSSDWLTLGKGLTPQTITTNSEGVGHEELFRSVAAIPVGTTFDIHFQIANAATGEVVLTSECYQYTVH